MFKLIKAFLNEHQMLRGMLAYSTLWPIGSLVQQTLVENKNFATYNYRKCLLYSAYGCFIVGPTLFMWMRVASVMWPKRNLKSSLAKAFTEQVAYDPFAIACFLWSMSLVEGKNFHGASEEVSTKFLEAYKIGFIYWPIVQTFNFTFISAKNQVIFASFFSLIWTSFLAYVKHLEIHHVKEKKNRAKAKGSFLSLLH